MSHRQPVRCNDKAAIRDTREDGDRVLDLSGIADVHRAHVHTELRRDGLDGREFADPGGYGGLPKDCYPRYAWRDFFEQLEQFVGHVVFIIHEAGDVAARPRQTINEAGGNRIGDHYEYDRYSTGRLQQGWHGRDATGQDVVGRERDQFLRLSANRGGIGRAPADVDVHVA